MRLNVGAPGDQSEPAVADGSLKHKSARAFLWSLSDGVGVAALSLATFIVLARILDPHDFGAVALAGVFVYFFNLLAYHSFTDALVQRAKLESQHLDTGFWGGLSLAVGLMLVCQLGAGPLATLLGEPAVGPVLSWLALTMPVAALGGVQAAMFRREMQFRSVASASLVGRAAGAGVGIAMALLGYGMWSLVGQQLVGTALTSLMLCLIARWRPGLGVKRRHFHELAGFGAQVSASQVLIGAADQVVNLLVGALFGSTVLGYFNVAARTMQLIRSLISGAVYHVSFSAFSRLQHDRAAVSRAFTQATRISCLVGVPAGVGMALVADLLVAVLYGEKWRLSGQLLQILALVMIPAFFGIFFSACYRAMSRPSWVIYLACGDLVVSLGGILALAGEGIVAVTIFWVAKAFVELPIHYLLLRRLLDTDVRHYAKPLLVPLAASLPLTAAVLGVRSWLGDGVGELYVMAACVAAGALLYVTAASLISPALSRMAIDFASRMLGAQRPSALSSLESVQTPNTRQGDDGQCRTGPLSAS